MGPTRDWLQMLIRRGSWQTYEEHAKLIREQVFIQEQHISDEDEWDAQDPISEHFMVYLDGQPVATARLLPTHKLGRVAVLKSYRGQGIGEALIHDVIAKAQQQKRPFVKLSSQVHAVGFYSQLGFETQGQPYMDCDIPHIDMYLKLDSQTEL